MCITTEKHLTAVTVSKVLQVDNTYKINWQGYPGIVAGVADANTNFRRMINILSTESSDDYSFVLKALKDGTAPDLATLPEQNSIYCSTCLLEFQPESD